MLRNYLSGTAGDQINTLLAATAYNMKKPTCNTSKHNSTEQNACGFDQTIEIKYKVLIKWMRLEKQKILDLIFGWFYQSLILVPVISKAREYKKNWYC